MFYSLLFTSLILLTPSSSFPETLHPTEINFNALMTIDSTQTLILPAHINSLVTLKESLVVLGGRYGVIYHLHFPKSGRNPVSTEELESPKRMSSVFPNPSQGGVFQISGVEQESLNFKVYDFQGRKLHSGRIDSARKIDLSHLQTGLFILILELRSGIETHSIIIE